jgi:hypothetical protein
MSTQKLYLPANLLNSPASVGCTYFLKGVKVNSFDLIAIYIIHDSCNVVFWVLIAFVIAFIIIIVRRKLKK